MNHMPSHLPQRKTAYHHDDLRRALLDAAIAYLDQGEVTGLTMQTLAKAAGVSPGAPYHHFPDKLSVLAALATEGFERWLTTASCILAQGGEPRTQLEQLSRAWLAFSRDYRSHYRIMFLRDLEDRQRFATLHETSGQSLELLVSLLSRCLPQAQPEEWIARAVTIWSTLHGFAALCNDGVLANIPQLPRIDELESRLIGLVVSSAFA